MSELVKNIQDQHKKANEIREIIANLSERQLRIALYAIADGNTIEEALAIAKTYKPE